MSTFEKINLLLTEKLSPSYLKILDESSAHAGHDQAKKSPGGHYQVTVVSSCFDGKLSLERHRIVYEILKGEFKDKIHALAIKAYTLKEWEQKNG